MNISDSRQSDIYISQDSVAKYFTFGGIFKIRNCCKFTTESARKRILKISLHLGKLWIYVLFFWLTVHNLITLRDSSVNMCILNLLKTSKAGFWPPSISHVHSYWLHAAKHLITVNGRWQYLIRTFIGLCDGTFFRLFGGCFLDKSGVTGHPNRSNCVHHWQHDNKYFSYSEHSIMCNPLIAWLTFDRYKYYCKKLNSLKHRVRTTVAESHN